MIWIASDNDLFNIITETLNIKKNKIKMCFFLALNSTHGKFNFLQDEHITNFFHPPLKSA